MHSDSFTIRASKPQSYLWFSLGSPLSLLCIWLGYQLAIGKDFWQGFLSALFFALFSLALGIKLYSERIQLVDNRLTLKSFFVNQSVDVLSLVRAERYRTVGEYPTQRLKLEDSSGHTLIINPSDYSMKDLEVLVMLISPYIFITRVDKNFTDLTFYVEQGIDVPKSSVGHIVRGTLLFIILPCFILTLLLIVWAILTKQPVFR